MTWMSAVFALLRLVNMVFDEARSRRLKGEGYAAAIRRVTDDAMRLVALARDAREASHADLDRGGPDRLHADDGFRRD